jgi:hypothetical protein
MCRFSFVQLLVLLPAAAGMVVSEKAQVARGRLFEALSSPSGKLTLSSEIIIPEPTDPTAILLQASGVTSMSEKIRSQAKANAAFISGSVTSLKTFCSEQEQARGNFPGPVPAIYCDPVEDLSTVFEAGAEGILVSVCEGNEIASLDDLAADTKWADVCKAALECGLQPIPEVTISDSTAASWKEADIEALLAKIAEVCGEEPVSLLMTVNLVDDEEIEMSLPTVSKALAKKIPILGSVLATAGENRMGVETARFKAAGFTGAFLRSACIPVKSMNQDLEYVGNFWSACIGDLKSTKSKSYQFQTRNYLNKSAPLEWAKYQKSIVESGSLGQAEDNREIEVDSSSGDYKGF